MTDSETTEGDFRKQFLNPHCPAERRFGSPIAYGRIGKSIA